MEVVWGDDVPPQSKTVVLAVRARMSREAFNALSTRIKESLAESGVRATIIALDPSESVHAETAPTTPDELIEYLERMMPGSKMEITERDAGRVVVGYTGPYSERYMASVSSNFDAGAGVQWRRKKNDMV